jgi:hypothetical protein
LFVALKDRKYLDTIKNNIIVEYVYKLVIISSFDNSVTLNIITLFSFVEIKIRKKQIGNTKLNSRLINNQDIF